MRLTSAEIHRFDAVQSAGRVSAITPVGAGHGGLPALSFFPACAEEIICNAGAANLCTIAMNEI